MGQRVTDGPTQVERTSPRDLVITRIFNAPVRLVFAAWTTPELFMLWWAPKSSGTPLLSCKMDVRTDGGYQVAFGHDAADAFTFFGKYLEVVPNARLVWTNDEGEEGAVTTVTFEALGEGEGERTRLVLHELYPSEAALDEAFIGMEDAMPEQFRQLDELLAGLTAKV